MRRAPLALASATSQRAGEPNAMRTGIVVSVGAAGVKVNIGGGVVTAGLVGGAGAGVAPGAVVTVFKQGSSWQVQGVALGPGQSAAGTPTQPVAATNTTILPPAVAGKAGAYRGATQTTLLSALSGGPTSTGLLITNLWPQGHLLRATVRNLQVFSTAAANYITVETLREGGSGGTVWAASEIVAPVAGAGQTGHIEGWLIGDGKVHTLELFAQTFTDASGVTLL